MTQLERTSLQGAIIEELRKGNASAFMLAIAIHRPDLERSWLLNIEGDDLDTVLPERLHRQVAFALHGLERKGRVRRVPRTFSAWELVPQMRVASSPQDTGGAVTLVHETAGGTLVYTGPPLRLSGSP